MKRRALIAGNWKMHGTMEEACELTTQIVKFCRDFEDREVLLAPPFTVLHEVGKLLKPTSILLGAQNVCWEDKGAFTGEISPAMISDAGGSAAIVGHSERRQIFFETDELINRRLRKVLDCGFMGILCVGESLTERDNGTMHAVLEAQLLKGLDEITASDLINVVIAYEPVWAIGTGKTATKEQAQEAHAFLRELLSKKYEKNLAQKIRILYGGSVKPSNIDELMAQQDIDGALVGGAALDAESFGRIINFQVA